ncbi:LysM peptidoglycan-binding domain-containing protein [Siminovitchia acidinfaciens]|uniref:LysM peptidoglycan-binding domain-containing protein n=1 Tax=Siminovitchia acidinfaciens TaxID=2321395 RepID=A0A429XY81_9BACI|nr:M23 family metallopeptidase [Siminovitchia acidinfaciens]RST73697.1 LysM peptidoglycan-binding domain-containing protein [Siminovitchia acidinfaciens]
MNEFRYIVAGLLLIVIYNVCNKEVAVSAQSVDEIQKVTGEWVFPANGVVSDVFSSRGGIHKGMDIAGLAQSSIYAVAEGNVIKSYYSDTYGHVVFLEHPDGFETVYAHLDKRLVSKGMKVLKGQEIGKMGNTGDSFGTHLHFEVHDGQWTVSKENAFDPFIVFGKGMVGDKAVALQPSINETIETYARPAEGPTTYVVKKGDTVWSISNKFNTTVESLSERNNLDTNHLVLEGQTLIIKEF